MLKNSEVPDLLLQEICKIQDLSFSVSQVKVCVRSALNLPFWKKVTKCYKL